ncbi:hypothetical protein, conserved [Babesia bigemina]|uniref:RAP domain-containing protein n=1 Tax=Babesia bigemina TaxID=5866 RepID=A0A061D1P0_BABBI|nr:hypothetical protein, conserved [Babesia bigemina]CDR94711.1 hypothetical protein, conserved [Babesia bigemina]|eukprot:XP_012766897.1 hypothetical protein, conserved [Babesia bigemina]
MKVACKAPHGALVRIFRRFCYSDAIITGRFACLSTLATPQGSRTKQTFGIQGSHLNCFRRFSTVQSHSGVTSEADIEPGNDIFASATAEGHGTAKANRGAVSTAEILATCAELAEAIVFDRNKHSARIRNLVSSLGPKTFTDALQELDCLNILDTKKRDAPKLTVENLVGSLSMLSEVCYVSAAAGIKVPANLLLGYAATLQQALLQLLTNSAEDTSKAPTSLQFNSIALSCTGEERNTLLEGISDSLGLILLSAAESGIGPDVLPLCNELSSENTLAGFIAQATGSCINSVAFVRAMRALESTGKVDGGNPELTEILPSLRQTLTALSNKEMTMTLRDLFYCKLWITCVTGHNTDFEGELDHMGRSFVDNVATIDHIVEATGSISDADTAMYAQLRRDKREVDLDYLTLEPFVFPLIGFSDKALYEADVPESYFDADARANKREWLKWRSAIAELNEWKIVEVRL